MASKSKGIFISPEEFITVRKKLEQFIKRELNPHEIEAIEEVIRSSNVQHIEKGCQKLFKPMTPNIAALCEVINEKISTENNSKNADWTYSVWSYHF